MNGTSTSKILSKILIILLILAIGAAALFFFYVKPEQSYQKALLLMENGDYSGAIEAFESLNGYGASVEKIALCKRALSEDDYQTAVTLMENGDYDAAIRAFELLGGYSDSEARIEECRDRMTALAEIPEKTSAEPVTGTAEIEAALDEEEPEPAVAPPELDIQELAVGETVEYGSYEQDADTTNGQEPVSWIVLENDGESVLLISSVVLDVHAWDTTGKMLKWDESELRMWLNTEFVESVFTKSEQELLSKCEHDVPVEGQVSSDVVTDRVFLLSYAELRQYFPGLDGYIIQPTPYALDRGAGSSTGPGADWWLRDAGMSLRYAAMVGGNGGLGGYQALDYENGIRPVIRLSNTE